MKIKQIIKENSNTIDLMYWPSDYILSQIEVPESQFHDTESKFQHENSEFIILRLDKSNVYNKSVTAPNPEIVNNLAKQFEINTQPDWDLSVYQPDGLFTQENLILVYPSKDHGAEMAVIHYETVRNYTNEKYKRISVNIRFNRKWLSAKIGS